MGDVCSPLAPTPSPAIGGLSSPASLGETEARQCFSVDGLSSPVAQPWPLDLCFLSPGCPDCSIFSLLLPPDLSEMGRVTSLLFC